ncbi:hypothetical protein [Bacillus swezeyi]|uniref:Type II secretion system protein GspF domain-containing protein n=1 Tax=Bacillus swezeyi TaxID=1925020 RepID=A0A5M8RJ94_9BACI|nr:hypothetical protein [Bacillus swezeyi]KAA6446914.1 hypothetical protein DX927_22955 [Bacillus swezeyi]KAA6471482.1 hypothetical protein DX928_23195 [Bacillus swezeyi]
MSELKFWIFENGIYFLLYLIFVAAGLYVALQFMQAPIKARLYDWNYRLRKAKSSSLRNVTSSSVKKNSALLRHIEILIRATSANKSENQLFSFITVSISLFVFGFLIMLLSLQDFVVALIVGVLISTIPYLLLQIKLRKIRFVMSNEFLNVLQSLTQNYNASHYDMYVALVETQKSIENKALKGLLIRLISDLQISKNEEDLKETILSFVFASGTSWSKRLGNIILKSYIHSENVLNALLVLGKQIEETEEMLEQEKSSAMDTVYNGYITLPVFIASLFLGYYSKGPQNWFHLQFGYKWTLFLFCFSLIGVIFSFIISSIIKRPKNDI